jgi:1-acyl-sn-glycerol-3-phosphate acyltransferase
MRVVPQVTSGSLNGQPADTPKPKAAAGDNPPSPEKYTSLLKASAGVGIALGIATIGSFLLFRLLNRMKVEGLENIPESHENVLYCPNHSSILDNFALGVGLYIPRMLFRPEYIPINLADRKNFFGDPSSRRLKDRVLRVLGEYFFKNLRTFPVDRRSAGGLEQGRSVGGDAPAEYRHRVPGRYAVTDRRNRPRPRWRRQTHLRRAPHGYSGTSDGHR